MTEETSNKWTTEALRLLSLFQSNQRSVGRFNPKTGTVHTQYRPPNKNDWMEHLAGKEGVGGVAILDDDTCAWAALDIDNHDAQDDIPIGPIDEKIRASRLPLIPCRSKSGGVHCYVFFDKPKPAGKVRAVMARWSELVGYAGCEVFPKQSKLLAGKDGARSLGNWINMPYMGGAETVRYAYRDSKKLSLDEFLDLAEKLKCTDAHLQEATLFDHGNAPPCVQQLITKGVTSGHRNEALFSITVYLRRAFPQEYEARAREMNGSVFDKPLPRAEMQRTIASAGRPDYSYRCGQEPIRSLCDKDVCLKRKYGINKNEYDVLAATQSLPEFSALAKYVSEPVRWEINVGGAVVRNIPTEVLLNWPAMRQLAAEKLTKIFPMIKNQEWERILQPLMAEARIIETPDDASVPGLIREKLREFASKANLASKGQDKEERKDMLRGLPCVQAVDGEKVVMFRAQDFVAFLQRTKSAALAGVNLYFAVKEMGVMHKKMRVGDYSINCWHIPVRLLAQANAEAPAPHFESKL